MNTIVDLPDGSGVDLVDVSAIQQTVGNYDVRWFHILLHGGQTLGIEDSDLPEGTSIEEYRAELIKQWKEARQPNRLSQSVDDSGMIV